jgi:hypothetical protein
VGDIEEELRMARREPWTLKQKALITATGSCLWVPMVLFIIYYRGEFSPRQIGAIGAVNLVVLVSLLALISEKWIRKIK